MEEIVVTKFDVAERQLLQSIHMFFREDDIISTHTVIEAANQVFSDIGKDYGVKSILRDNDIILPAKRKFWLNELFRSRNFFKHADRDKDDKHEFKSMFNDFSLFDGVSMHRSIRKVSVPETLLFEAWFYLTYPDLLVDGSKIQLLIASMLEKQDFPKVENKEDWYGLLKSLRDGSESIKGVSLSYGL